MAETEIKAKKILKTLIVCMYVRYIVMFAHCDSNNSHECADEAYALPKRNVFSWRQNDVSVSTWLHSDAGKQFHVDRTTTVIVEGTARSPHTAKHIQQWRIFSETGWHMVDSRCALIINILCTVESVHLKTYL